MTILKYESRRQGAKVRFGGGGGVSRLGEKRVIGKIQKITISEFTREAGLSTLEAYG